MDGYRNAEKGKLFVVTEKGYEATPDKIKYERTVGQPIPGLEGRIPEAWIEKGYVQQVDTKEVYIPFTHEGKEHYLYVTNSRWPGTLNFDILSDSHTLMMVDMSCTVDPSSMSAGDITGADGEPLIDEGLRAAIEGAVGEYTGRHPEIAEVWKAAKRLDRVYFEHRDYGKYYVDIVAVRENGKQGEFRFAVTDADNGYMGIVGKTFTVDFDTQKVEFPQSMILEDMQFPIQDAIIRSLNEHYPALENRAYYEERLEQDKDPQQTEAHLSQEEEMAENMQGKILKIQDDRIYFDYKGEEGEGFEHYIRIGNSNWPGMLPYSVFGDMPGENAQDELLARYPAFGGFAIVDPETMAVTGLSPELENKDAQAEIISVFQEYVNSHPEIGKAWEETMHSAKKLDRVSFKSSYLDKYYVDGVSLGKKGDKEEFLFNVVCEEDVCYGTYLTGEKCTFDLNTGEIEFPDMFISDAMAKDIKRAMRTSIVEYYLDDTKARSVSPEYFTPPQRPETPMEALEKIIKEKAPEESPALKEILKYMDEMDSKYNSMRSELQSLREQLAERSDNSGLGKKVVESLEKNTKSFKERIDGFKKKLFQKAADVICNFKEKGTIALHNIVQKLGIKENIQSHTEYCMAQAKKMQKSVEKLDAINVQLNSVKGHIKNIGRAIIGKEAQDPQQQKESIFIKMLKRPYIENRDSYMKMAEQGIKRLDRLEALEAKAVEARLHQGEKGAKRDSTLQKLSDYKKEAASRDEAKNAPGRENIKKDMEMAL